MPFSAEPITAFDLAQAWNTCVHTSGLSQVRAVQNFERLVERLLDQQDGPEVVRSAKVGDRDALFRALQDAAGKWSWASPAGTVQTELWMVPLCGDIDEATAWLNCPKTTERLRGVIEGWWAACATERPVVVEPLSGWVSPRAVASCDAFRLRHLAMRLIGEEGVDASFADEQEGAAGEAVPRDLAQDAVRLGQRFIPVAVVLRPEKHPLASAQDRAALWDRLSLPLALPPSVSTAAPRPLRAALGHALIEAIEMHWQVQRLGDASDLGEPASDEGVRFLDHVSLASGGDSVCIRGFGPHGPVAPLMLPATWAFCQGQEFLRHSIERWVRLPPDAPPPRKPSPRRLH